MTQEDKKLLLNDLCARLPYGVIVKMNNPNYLPAKLTAVNIETELVELNTIRDVPVGTYKPYLRPMSSMTEEEFESLKEYSGLKYEQLDLASFQDGAYKCLDFYLNEVPAYVVILVFDWLNAHHFDFRGLLERGLAIAVTKENDPYKQKIT